MEHYREKELTVQDHLTAIRQYMESRGFYYEEHVINSLYLSLKTKPFVILAGSSGMGKSCLARLFARAVGGRLLTVSVHPNWSDSADLLGYMNASGQFCPGEVAEFIGEARENLNTPYFLCLEEMNLARAEYYFSDFLTVMQTRTRREDGTVETDSFRLPGGQNARISIPENLYIIGTVNMDETTFFLTKKVLDRANIIELSGAKLVPGEDFVEQTDSLQPDNSFLKTDYLHLADCEDRQQAVSLCEELTQINQILAKGNLQIGYGIRDGIVIYMMHNQKEALVSQETAWDLQILQRILPRIQGSNVAVREMLSDLFVKCAGEYREQSSAAWQQMQNYLHNKPCRYPKSARKLAFMMRRYEEDGFACYWL